MNSSRLASISKVIYLGLAVLLTFWPVYAQNQNDINLGCAGQMSKRPVLNYTVIAENFSTNMSQFSIEEQEQIPPNSVLAEYFGPREDQPFNISFEDKDFAYRKPYILKGGLSAVFGHYGPEIDPNLIKIVKTVEFSLPPDRLQFVLIEPKIDMTQKDQVLGFLRMFDGSLSSKFHSAPDLPLELILQRMNKYTRAVEVHRVQKKTIREIGKYYLDRLATPYFRNAAKSDIIFWLINKVLENDPENSIYFAHVASEQHQRAYTTEFGFEISPRELSVGLAPNENILEVSGTLLLKRLRERARQIELSLNLPPRKTTPTFRTNMGLPYWLFLEWNLPSIPIK